MSKLSRYDSASLATQGHIYCAGTLAQCLRRWDRLSAEDRNKVYLRMGRDGMPSTIIGGEKLAELARIPELRDL